MPQKQPNRPDRQAQFWDPKTGGVSPDALNLIETLREIKEVSETPINDEVGHLIGREWVYGLGRTRTALRVIARKPPHGNDLPEYTFTMRDHNKYPIVHDRSYGLRLAVPAVEGQSEIPVPILFAGSLKLEAGRGIKPNTWDLSLALPDENRGLEDDELELSHVAIKRLHEVLDRKAKKYYGGELQKDKAVPKLQIVSRYGEEDSTGDPRTDYLTNVFGFEVQSSTPSVDREHTSGVGKNVDLLWTHEIERKHEDKRRSTLRKPR